MHEMRVYHVIVILALFFISKISGQPSPSCHYDTEDSLQSKDLSSCADKVKSLGREQANKLIEMNKMNAKPTVADPAIKQILDLPLALAECLLKNLDVMSGDRDSYNYKSPQFVDKPNLPDVVKTCSEKSPVVCPFKELDRSACLPHPLPLLKCVRKTIFKSCGSINSANSPSMPSAAATNPAMKKPIDDEDEDPRGNSRVTMGAPGFPTASRPKGGDDDEDSPGPSRGGGGAPISKPAAGPSNDEDEE